MRGAIELQRFLYSSNISHPRALRHARARCDSTDHGEILYNVSAASSVLPSNHSFGLIGLISAGGSNFGSTSQRTPQGDVGGVGFFPQWFAYAAPKEARLRDGDAISASLSLSATKPIVLEALLSVMSTRQKSSRSLPFQGQLKISKIVVSIMLYEISRSRESITSDSELFLG